MAQPITTVQIDRDISGLVGLWHINEGNGTNVADSSPEGNTGTLNHDDHWVAGKFSNAFDFDGGDYVTLLTNNFPVGSSPRTIMAWVYTEDAGAVNAIFSYGKTTNTNLCAGWLHNGTVIYWDGFNCSTPFTYNYPIAEWFHIAFLYDGAAQFIYINGVSLGAGESPIGNPADLNTIIDTSKHIGHMNYGAYYFRGIIDEFTIIDRELSVAEIKHLYHRQPALLF